VPGTVIAMARLNRPSIMVYGGTIKPGFSQLDGHKLDVISAFQSFGVASGRFTCCAASPLLPTHDWWHDEVLPPRTPGWAL